MDILTQLPHLSRTPPPPSLNPVSHFFPQTDAENLRTHELCFATNRQWISFTTHTDLYWLSSPMAGWLVETLKFPVWMWWMLWMKGNFVQSLFLVCFPPCHGQTRKVTVASNNQVFSFPHLAILPKLTTPISFKSGDAEWTTIICMTNANGTMKNQGKNPVWSITTLGFWKNNAVS